MPYRRLRVAPCVWTMPQGVNQLQVHLAEAHLVGGGVMATVDRLEGRVGEEAMARDTSRAGI